MPRNGGFEAPTICGPSSPKNGWQQHISLRLSPRHLHLKPLMRCPRRPPNTRHRCLPHHSNIPGAGHKPRVQQPAQSLNLPRTRGPDAQQVIANVAAQAAHNAAAARGRGRRGARGRGRGKHIAAVAALAPPPSGSASADAQPDRTNRPTGPQRRAAAAEEALQAGLASLDARGRGPQMRAYTPRWNCGAPSVPLCELASGLLLRVLPLKKSSVVGNCSCWPRACSFIGRRAMHASTLKGSSGDASSAGSLGGGFGHSCSAKPRKPPAHPSPPAGLRRPRMLGGLAAPLPSCTLGNRLMRLARWSQSRLHLVRMRHPLPSCVILRADPPNLMLPLRPTSWFPTC